MVLFNMSKPLHFEKSIDKLDVLFKYSGMNIKNKIVTHLDMIKHRWVYVFNFFWVLLASLPCVYYLVVGVQNGGNLQKLTSVAPCLTISLLGWIKSFCHYLNEEYVKELLVLLKQLEIEENAKEECADKKDIKDKEIEFLNTIINVLYMSNYSLIVVFNTTPLIVMAVTYFMTNEFELRLPYLDVFSFIPNELKYWPFAYVLQAWSVCAVVSNIASADYLFFTFCTYIRVQFKLLQYNFERIIPANLLPALEELEMEAQENIVACVKWHRDLIYSSKLLNIIYSKSALFNFLLSSVLICLAGFNVTAVNNLEVIIPFLTFLFLCLMQIFFFCFFADKLMSASLDVSNAVYNSRWYLAKNFGRELLIVQIRAQEPCKLNAAGFADVNLRAFTKVKRRTLNASGYFYVQYIEEE